MSNLVNIEEAQIADEHIPKPCGYHLLVLMPNPEDTFGSGIIQKSAKTLRDEQILSMVGAVVDMGCDAYKDKTRFPEGAWCATGDYVMFRSNTGTRFKIGSKEFRLINDDSVQAVVEDPEKIQRVF